MHMISLRLLLCWAVRFPAGATKYGWSARVTRLGPDSLLAVLNVPPATPDFAGNYSCGPPSLQPASVTLHVLNGTRTHKVLLAG